MRQIFFFKSAPDGASDVNLMESTLAYMAKRYK